MAEELLLFFSDYFTTWNLCKALTCLAMPFVQLKVDQRQGEIGAQFKVVCQLGSKC